MNCSSLNDFYGFEEKKEDIRKALHYFSHPKFYEENHLEAFSGILIVGDPGTGKSTLLSAIANELGYPWYSPEGCPCKVYQETDYSQFDGVVIWDDVTQESFDEYHDEMIIHPAEDILPFFLVLAARSQEDIPQRLLDCNEGGTYMLVDLNEPTRKDTDQIITKLLGTLNYPVDVEAEDVCRMCADMNGWEFTKLMKHARRIAALRSGAAEKNTEIPAVTEADIVEAMASIYPAEGSGADGYDVALHEAGHVVIAEMLHPGSVGLATAYQHGNDYWGVTKIYSSPEDTYEKVMFHLLLRLGGMAPFTSDCRRGVDMGCGQDLDQVFMIATGLITNECIHGVQFHSLGDADSQLLKAKQEEEVAKFVKENLRQAEKMLDQNYDFLKAVTAALEKKKYLTFRDIEKIKETTPCDPYDPRRQ